MSIGKYASTVTAVVAVIVVLAFMTAPAGAGSKAEGIDGAPLIRYLGNAISLSALDEKTIDGLDGKIRHAVKDGVTRKEVEGVLVEVRKASGRALSALVEKDIYVASPAEAMRVRSLVDVLTITEVVAEVYHIKIDKDVTHYDHKCKREHPDDSLQCLPAKGYNCRHTRAGCIQVKRD